MEEPESSRASLSELQNRALSAGISSEKVRAAINDLESPHERLLALLLDHLHTQYVNASETLAESPDAWKVLSAVPPQASARRDLSLEPQLQQRLQGCVESGDFSDFEFTVLQELAVGVGAERRDVAAVIDVMSHKQSRPRLLVISGSSLTDCLLVAHSRPNPARRSAARTT